MKMNPNEIQCHECKKGLLLEHKGTYEASYLDRRGVEQKLEVPALCWLRCNTCGEEVLDDRVVSTIEAARRKALGLLNPEEIRNFRVRTGKSQKAISDFLGVGEKSYCRWESGAYMQSEAFDRYLRLLIYEPRNLDLLQRIIGEKAASSPDADAPSPL